MDARLDYAGMFIVKDQLCEGTRWHVRTMPADPAVDPYFPMGQAAVTLRRDEGKIRVSLRTMTPNLKTYEARFDGGLWRSSGETFLWSIHPGLNRLEVRTMNQFGVNGPISTIEVEQ
jgi:hypothetical protein